MRRSITVLLVLLLSGLFCVYFLKNAPEDKAEKHVVQKKNTEVQPVQISEADRERAGQILDFFNTAEKNTSEDWFTQADHIAFFVRIYLGEWQLPKYDKPLIDQKSFLQKLSPPDDLFDPSKKKSLQAAVARMYEALATMHSSYRELERYVGDTTIQDDGVKGKRLSKKINAAYQTFGRAKKEYFSLFEQEAVWAENIFLEDNPLRRQILEAKVLFSLLRDVSFELSSDTVDLSKTRALEKQIFAHIEKAERPPFKGHPLAERQYREFLKKARLYAEDLRLGNQEGFYPHVRNLLNTDLANIRSGYNAFIQYLNDHEN